MIVLLPNRREIDTLHSLKNAGLAISTVSGKGRMYNVARPLPVLVLTNAVPMQRHSVAEAMFDFARRPQ